MNDLIKIGKKIFHLNRSLTGKDNLKTLKIFKNYLPILKIKFFKPGKKVYDWTIPNEWNVKEAYIKDKSGTKIVNFDNNCLHLMSYSRKINKRINKINLLKKLYTNKRLKNAIPYVTSYYKKNWGFCITENQKQKIKKKYKDNDTFKIVIDTSFKRNGRMHYGEIFIPGKTKKEILISTYICHPSMANNELSGPLVSLALAKYFSRRSNKRGIRFIFIPETIGAIAYIQKNFIKLKKNVIGGYVLTCIGDEKNYSMLYSKYGNSISDEAAIDSFKKLKIKYKSYNFLERGSDERQFNSPKINLGISSLMRSKYGKFKEYHTSLDVFGKVVTLKGLKGGYKLAKYSIISLMSKENNNMKLEISKNNPLSKITCEPFLTKRNLVKSVSNLSSGNTISKLRRDILNFLQYSDGTNNIISIAKQVKLNQKRIDKIFKICKKFKLLY